MHISIYDQYTINIHIGLVFPEPKVCCAGRPGLVRGDWIKPGAVVIDVGMNVSRAEAPGRPDIHKYVYIYIHIHTHLHICIHICTYRVRTR